MFYVNLQFYSGIILINLCLFGYLMINVNIIIIIHVNCIGIGNKFMTSGSRQIKIKQYVCNKNISKHLFFSFVTPQVDIYIIAFYRQSGS